MKKLLQRLAALAGVGALLASASIVGVAVPASAHTGDLKVTAVCNTQTGQYDLTATLAISQTGLTGETKWRVGTPNFEGTPSNADGMDRGPVASNGAGTITLGTWSVPGTTTGKGPWVYAYTQWSDRFTKASDGQLLEDLKGDCTIPVTPLPADKGIDCSTAWLQPGRALQNGDHINIDILVNGSSVQRNAYVDQNIQGGYNGLGLRIETGNGQVTQPLTEEAVKTGKFSFNFGQYVSGYYEVQWAQFNSTYFNQDRNPANFIKCGTPPPPPVTNQCVPGQGVLSTDLNDLWQNVDTRADGRVEYVDGGLHVWTLNNSSQAKVSEGIAHAFDLKNTGTLALDWTGSTPPPGINLFVDFGADGKGTLVYESVYGQDLWLTNGSSAAVKANAPVNGGGNGSQWHGTIDQWLTKYPDAKVTGIAYSLGSGVLGDGIIKSITVNCTVFTFDKVDVPVTPPDKVDVTYGEWVNGEYDCDDTEYTQTRTVTTGKTSYRVEVQNGAYVVVPNETVVTTETESRTVPRDADCPVVTPPSEPPMDNTPTPTPTPVVLTQVGSTLPATGGEVPWGLIVVGGLGVVAGGVFLLYRRLADK